MDKKEFINYANEHLISSHQAREITGQKLAAFKQSVKNEKLIPALVIPESETRVIRLFFREDVIAYKERMKEWQSARKPSK
ncbi:hypothetical protein [Listeria booriae]|uniref:DNA-binding protein n=1 Tax=Listeria booriae TaxID=1552123 RepID=A0A7X0XBH6_9LIST|nr:hypothetical protein [Listeria booriae]MBC1491018.1 hypothetical protein [Listeria booriae]MBC1491067.1 hypothetical protein [Listeria booriae]MBC1914215.1 hypothetical protein [Listeria booriae]MBC2173909.1 hypothetical protein [Listeria booriae]MBC2178235.1 hypothetical protein [Listeria booriae]